MNKNNTGPKILLLDIETAPLLGFCWGLWENNIALNQIHTDWYILSWSAKWLDSSKVMYEDNRNSKNLEDDSKLLKGIWKLLDEADIVIGHNSKHFDIKKLNARFVQSGMCPPSSFKQIDTLELAKKHFSFTSNKLEYLSDKLCKKHKKLKHTKFPGFEMWSACLKGNKDAWNEMERYNKVDVLALQELYEKLRAWDSSINFNLYTDQDINVCTCGGKEFVKNGYFFTTVGKYQRYRCTNCGSEAKDRNNLLSKSKLKSLKTGVRR